MATGQPSQVGKCLVTGCQRVSTIMMDGAYGWCSTEHRRQYINEIRAKSQKAAEPVPVAAAAAQPVVVVVVEPAVTEPSVTQNAATLLQSLKTTSEQKRHALGVAVARQQEGLELLLNHLDSQRALLDGITTLPSREERKAVVEKFYSSAREATGKEMPYFSEATEERLQLESEIRVLQDAMTSVSVLVPAVSVPPPA